MSEEQKQELLREIRILMEGRCMQTKLAEAILSMVGHVNRLTEIAICESAKGNNAESDEICSRVMGYSEKLYEITGRREVYPGCNSK